MFKSLHLNKYYAKVYKSAFNPTSVDYSGPDVINTKFASNVLKQYKHHQSLNYPKNMPGGDNSFAGWILYNNNNNATKQTASAFTKYFHNYMMYHASIDCDIKPSKTNKSNMNWFTNHYNNVNYKGKVGNFAQWRTISNKKQSNSAIRFVVSSYGWNNYYTKD